MYSIIHISHKTSISRLYFMTIYIEYKIIIYMQYYVQYYTHFT